MPLISIDDVAEKPFDYIIIGGGTTGLTIATRLSENPEISVLVLEAGAANFNHPLISKSSQHGFQFGNPDLDWCFQTTPQKHGLDVQYYWNRGKTLGGSSSINFQLWVHPPKADVDNWERLGNPGWNWDMFEQYSSRVYNVDKTKLQVDGWKIWDATKSYGTGNVKVSLPNVIDSDIKFRESLVMMGVPKAPAPYHGNPNGAYINIGTYDPNDYSRVDAATAYLRPNLLRPNLVILTSALVHNLIFDSADGDLVATGVQFSSTTDKTPRRAYAHREVVLCAGAIKSPQVLELSGIGQAKVLKQIGVPLRLELPGVGENVQEHQVVGVANELKEECPDMTYDLLRDEKEYAAHGELLTQGKGLHTIGITNLTYAPLSTFSGMARAKELYSAQKKKIEEHKKKGVYPPGREEQYNLLLDLLDPEKGNPDVELVGFPGYISFPRLPIPGKRYYTLCAVLNHNFSRGTIHATSRDPYSNPEMDPHYFENDIETQSMVETVKWLRRLAQTMPIKENLDHEHNPGPEVQTDEQVEEWVKKGSITVFHTIGSCSMLPLNKNGVVDPNLKVYGTRNVRVADLSIVPLHIAAHTQSVAYVIAERAADIIRSSAKY
ncbi:GMC oxidoreductase [Dendrothele bispora CBS 962.96]|uniref:GMC oxidoreductase n=1 Tax=Dendrothele bispora (strain CBS 962.96) TaxID=1314807 RepID=A0A4S8L546_DENBC|nr:GMC oxidoreductase [Dendrothele bispora CBS 962.96]